MKQYRKPGFNFSAFGLEDERAQRSPSTVGFRMMEGTTRSGLLLNWVCICASVCEAAVEGAKNRFCRTLGWVLDHNGNESHHGRTENPRGKKGRKFREMMQDLVLPEPCLPGFKDKVTLDSDSWINKGRDMALHRDF